MGGHEGEHEVASGRERHLRELLEAVEDVTRIGGWELDVATSTLRWTPGTFRIHETTPEEYTPTVETAIAFYTPEHQAIIARAVEDAARDGTTYCVDLELVTAKGKRIPVRATGRAERRDGVVVRIYGAIQDLADEVRARAALRRQTAQLEASQRMEAIGLLAGGVAHDFNNLLTIVQGNAEGLLAGASLPEGVRAQLGEIREAARRAAELTRQLLAFGRKQVLRPVRLDLCVLVEDMARLLGRVVGEHIAIVKALPSAPAWVEADRSQLEQVLLNLAINARDAMPSGGTLTLGVEEVALEAGATELPAGRYHTLVVRDDGIGMDETVKARIFEPFFTTKDPARGTGLGLATVYGIVKQSGGAVVVESTPGVGSTFRVVLPVAEAVTAEAPAPEPPSPPVATRKAETILLVEDDDAVRRVCRRVLEKQGYTVLEAAGPTIALDIAAERPNDIALVLTDVVMPVMSGPELVLELRRTHPGIRYLLISGYADDMDQLKAALAEGMTFLPKPFTPDQLGRAVREALAGEGIRAETG